MKPTLGLSRPCTGRLDTEERIEAKKFAPRRAADPLSENQELLVNVDEAECSSVSLLKHVSTKLRP